MTPAELSATVKVLASDLFGGRSPGTPGEARTVAYLVDRLKALGLRPTGPDGGWTQTVPMIHAVPGAPTALAVTVAGKSVPVTAGTDIAPGTARDTSRVTVMNAPLVFVGYGVSAPERGWDDFKGVDLRGKVAVFLVNDPDYAARPGEDAYGKFGGQAMTYYGRWTLQIRRGRPTRSDRRPHRPRDRPRGLWLERRGQHGRRHLCVAGRAGPAAAGRGTELDLERVRARAVRRRWARPRRAVGAGAIEGVPPGDAGSRGIHDRPAGESRADR